MVLVEVKIPENIGFIARVMKNFGFRQLCLYKCNVNERSFITAAHAKDVLENAIFLNKKDEFHDFLSKFNFVVGTTGVSSKDEKYLRKPTFTPESVDVFGKTAVLFGREDFGLLSDELEICNAVVSIPTDENYPVMNVSHAAAVILYEFRKKMVKSESEEYATLRDLEVLLKNVESMLKDTWYPEHRLRKTIVTFRRVLGRSKLTKREVLTLNGVFRKTRLYIRMLKSQLKRNEKI